MSEPINECNLPKNVVQFNTESVWFRITAFILAAVGAAIFITNTVYWNRFRSRASTMTTPTKREADGLYYTNLILSIIFVALAVWALFRLVYYESERKRRIEAIKDGLRSAGSSLASGVSSAGRSAGSAITSGASSARSYLSSTNFGVGAPSSSAAAASPGVELTTLSSST